MGVNFRSAEKYGDLKVILPHNKNIVLSSGPVTMKLKKELKNFNDDDYLLLIGLRCMVKHYLQNILLDIKNFTNVIKFYKKFLWLLNYLLKI